MSEVSIVIKESGLKKFKSGHPWVFANDAFTKRSRIESGTWCRLEDEHHQFLGRGILNLDSQIVFREWTRSAEIEDPVEAFRINFLEATRRREKLDQSKYSHRLIFSEGDSMSGIIVDLYVLESLQKVFVAQILTAGAERFTDQLHDLLGVDLKKDVLLIQRSAASRRREGLPQMKTELRGKSLSEADLRSVTVLFASASPKVLEPVKMTLDLVGGQKTGFFLDQFDNIKTVIGMLPKIDSKKTIKIVDLFCYLGQWGLQLGRHLKHIGHDVEVDLVDISDKALDAAQQNLSHYGIQSNKIKLDYVKDAKRIATNRYDIVILDPPALIKSKKDKLLGNRAYQRVNDFAMQLSVPGGVFVTCSCSYNLSEDDLRDLLKESARKTKRSIAWVAQGWQAKDHPMRTGFPEGSYLKAFIGLSR